MGEQLTPRQRLAAMRREYERHGLDEADLAPTWLAQLERWLADAIDSALPEPNAMVLTTASAGGAPSARTVLLKGAGDDGLRFFTNGSSRKGRELAENPRATALFPWLELHRQVTAEGRVERLPEAESQAYFDSRPWDARIGALASPQSQPVPSREWLEERRARIAAEHPEGGPVPRPEGWGGYVLIPEQVEFWQGRSGRLHDRLRFRREAQGAWIVERLAP